MVDGRGTWMSFLAFNLCFPAVSGASSIGVASRRPEFMDVVNVLDKLLIVMAAARVSLSCSLRNGLGRVGARMAPVEFITRY